ncbi:MAG TPA: hypothetical protein ENJ09_02585 [Planctomycetes bacterium]|nr:hypothetical protein [Planctomycetota bacterium]
MTARSATFLFLATALSALASTPSSQERNSPPIRRVTTSLRRARLDMESGTIQRGAMVAEKGAPNYSTTSTLNNNDFSGFVGVGSGPAGSCEWIDAADKGQGHTGGASGLLTGFAFAYCSAALDTLSGGPGGKTRIGFRTGYTLRPGPPIGLPPNGTDVGTFNLSGLPANTSYSSFLGGFTCYMFDVDLGTTPVVLEDGPVGWSWQFRDVGTDGVLAATFPFLSCVQSCSGNGPDNTGNMVNAIDVYCPAGSLLGRYSFGTGAGGSAYFASVSMDMREAEAIASANVVFNGSGTNPLILTATTTPRLGQVWSVDLDCAGADPTKLAYWRISFLPPLPMPKADPPRIGELLIETTGMGRVFFAPHGGGVVQLGGFPLPFDLSFYGMCWNLQGLCGDTPQCYYSNGLTQTMSF